MIWYQFPYIVHAVKDITRGYPDSKVHGANMGPIWGQQDPDGTHVDPMKFAIWETNQNYTTKYRHKCVIESFRVLGHCCVI